MNRALLFACATLAVMADPQHTANAGGGEPSASRRGSDVDGGPWQLCMKTYTFHLRKMTFYESIDQTAAWGLKAVEAFPGQKIGGDLSGTMDFHMNEATRDKVRAKLRNAGVAMVGYGVARPKTDDDCRRLFEFAGEMGVRFLVMEPEAPQLDLLEKMADETGIEIAIHNHPQPSVYWNPETVLTAVKGRSRRLGACADTGHWVRSGLDPVDCLRELEGHIVMLHFKDLDARSAAARDTAWGQGACDAAGMMAELRRQGFRGWFSIEYENADDAMEKVPQCIAFFKQRANAGPKPSSGEN
ncbi:MAG: sugar phosphate isomerase/epimerase [bacterium]|nr:sugar phosphate isomerase/epimerase [bacterium]